MDPRKFITTLNSRKPLHRIAFGIDSLTSGSGAVTPMTYGIPLAASLRTARGDAGFGPMIWGNNTTAGFAHGGTMIAVESLNAGGGSTSWLDPIKLGSMNGRGYYLDGGLGDTDTGYLTYTQNTADGFSRGSTYNVATAKIYFTLRSSGAAIKARQSDQPAAQAVTYDSATHEIGVPQVATYTFNSSYNQTLQVFHCTDNVTIDMVEPQSLSSSGLTLTDLGLGGISAFEWSQLDDTAQRAWWSLMNFDLVVLNLGMNDRSFASASNFGDYVAAIVGRIRAAGTRVYLIRPNDSSDWATTNLADYAPVLQSVAAEYGCSYADDRDVLGNYAAANAAGYMQVDGIHPTGEGNSLRGAYHASRILSGRI